MLKTNRGLLKTILLSIVTIGIYPIVQMCGISNDINTIAGRYDGKKTMFYLWVLLLTPFGGIVPLVWFHRISKRIGKELERRGVPYKFGAADYWLWNMLGSLILVGPFVFTHKLMTAMNRLNDDFNRVG